MKARTEHAAPVILPFRRPEPVARLAITKTFLYRGRLLQVRASRWRSEDAANLEVETRPIPGLPGRCYSLELYDVASSSLIPAASASGAQGRCPPTQGPSIPNRPA